MELTHAELEHYHYEALKTNPLYAMQCQQEFYLEEIQLDAPCIEPIHLEVAQAPEPRWTHGQWDKVRQLEAKVLYLESKLNTHLDPPKKKSKNILREIEI